MSDNLTLVMGIVGLLLLEGTWLLPSLAMFWKEQCDSAHRYLKELEEIKKDPTYLIHNKELDSYFRDAEKKQKDLIQNYGKAIYAAVVAPSISIFVIFFLCIFLPLSKILIIFVAIPLLLAIIFSIIQLARFRIVMKYNTAKQKFFRYKN